MAGLFGYDGYSADRRTRQLMERAFRQRQIQTIIVAALVSAALTASIGLGLLWLGGSFASTTASRSIEAAVVAPNTAADAEKPGCLAEGCLRVTPNIDAQPVVQQPSFRELPIAVENEGKPEGRAGTSSDNALMIRTVDAPAQPALPAETVTSAPAAAVTSATAVAPPANAAGTATEETRRFIQRGRSFAAQGDVTTARLFFERASDRGDRAATFALAETYDPVVLKRWKARNVLADLDRAWALYKQALAAGMAEAQVRMKELAGN